MIDRFYTVWSADEIDSTNLWIRRLREEGAPEGTVAVADMQTAGRGRLGRSWYSPKGDGIFFSILLVPRIEPAKAPMLSLLMGLAVRAAVAEAAGKETLLKWPNDVIISGKKVCGILTELIMEEGQTPYAILGTGINNGNKSFAPSLADRATSIYLECGHPAERNALLEKILNHFLEDYRRFRLAGDLSDVQEEYNSVLVNRGRTVVIREKDETWKGTAEGIGRTGELIVRKEDGTEAFVNGGEVSVRGVYGYT